jgi:hypothetical protein
VQWRKEGLKLWQFSQSSLHSCEHDFAKTIATICGTLELRAICRIWSGICTVKTDVIPSNLKFSRFEQLWAQVSTSWTHLRHFDTSQQGGFPLGHIPHWDPPKHPQYQVGGRNLPKTSLPVHSYIRCLNLRAVHLSYLMLNPQLHQTLAGLVRLKKLNLFVCYSHSPRATFILERV